MTNSATRDDILSALKLGWARRCPRCGKGSAFSGYLRIRDQCGSCGEELHHHRADDAPAYLTMVVAGLVTVPLIWFVEARFRPPIVLHFIAWPILATILSLLLLPRFKGAVLALQWVLRMHGFEARRSAAPPGRTRRR